MICAHNDPEMFSGPMGRTYYQCSTCLALGDKRPSETDINWRRWHR